MDLNGREKNKERRRFMDFSIFLRDQNDDSVSIFFHPKIETKYSHNWDWTINLVLKKSILFPII